MENKSKIRQITEIQKLFISNYISELYNITEACKLTRVNRGRYYEWLEENEDFKLSMKEAEEELVDWVQTQAKKRIMEGSDKLIEFYLKTKGKSHGFGETSEIHHRIDHSPVEIIFGNDPTDKKDIPSSDTGVDE